MATKGCNLFHKALSKAHIPLITKPGEKGFEPLTFGFGNHYSTVETILLTFVSQATRANLVQISISTNRNKGLGDPVLWVTTGCCLAPNLLLCTKFGCKFVALQTKFVVPKGLLVCALLNPYLLFCAKCLCLHAYHRVQSQSNKLAWVPLHGLLVPNIFVLNLT